MEVYFTVADVNDYDWPVSSVDGAVAIVVQFARPEQRQAMTGGSHRVATLEFVAPGAVLLDSDLAAGKPVIELIDRRARPIAVGSHPRE